MEFQISSSTLLIIYLFTNFALNAFAEYRSSDTPLIPEDEVKVLNALSRKIENLNWNVTPHSCINGLFNYKTGVVICNCNFSVGNSCHVTNIIMSSLNLSGVLPSEFRYLIHLQELDLSHNAISGQIPREIGEISTLEDLGLGDNKLEGTLPSNLRNLKQLRRLDLSYNAISGQIPREIGEISTLEYLFLSGNAFSGQIPREIDEISTLKTLRLDDNMLEGTLPSSLGNLKQLRVLVLSGNNFSGTIHESFGNLKKLEILDLSGNNFSGAIPESFGNLKNLELLRLRGTSMEGPIPTAISQLTNLTRLSISDLHGPTMMTFPNLKNLTSLKYLDLSFNKLFGKIPDEISDLSELKYMFLTQNNLSGKIPEWIKKDKDKYFDLSYNNFGETSFKTCQFNDNINLAASMSSLVKTSLVTCMKRDLPCGGKPKYHSLFINCGGAEEIKYERNKYEEDSNPGGISFFYLKNEKWAYSSTGAFTGPYSARSDNDYLATNIYNLNISGPSFYQTARLSPLSLKYHGFCMVNGNYTVKLYFAEIMISHEHNSTSLGRRIFDVSIQGKKYLSDFNIAKEAGGVGKGIVRAFNIEVNHNNLEIHFYWAGKGTDFLPKFGSSRGPLISAISVTPNFKIGSGISGGAIAGIVVGSCLFILLILFVFLKMAFGYDKDSKYKHLLDLKTGYFPLKQIKDATDNFAPENKIGEGGFGPVYKGVLSDGVAIAVKKLSSTSKQGSREFVNEIGIIFALQHPNLVKLYGCCIEGNQLLLIYEYMDNNNLAKALLGGQGQKIHLDWPTRMNICVGIARGLVYLHEESSLKIVHRDIKATNVLLDKDLNAKISDFGLAKLYEDGNTQITTRVAGTIGYMAPEYAMRGHLTSKADVYSFGVVVLEIASGKSNTGYRPNEDIFSLLDWAYVLQEQGKLLELVDPSLRSSYSLEEVMRMFEVALLCTNPSPTLRPSMSSVVSMLEGKMSIQAQVIKHWESVDPFDMHSFQDSLSQTFNSSIKSNQSGEEIVEAMNGPSSHQNQSQTLASSSFSHESLE